MFYYTGDIHGKPDKIVDFVHRVRAAKQQQAIENIATPSDKARKVMMDGTLYIATPDGKIYNATGVQVK